MLADIEANLCQSLTAQPPRNVEDMNQGIARLLQLPPSPEQWKLMERLLVGELVPDQPPTYAENYVLLQLSGWARMINYLHEHGRLTYEIFSRSIWRNERLAGCVGKYKPLSRRYDQLPDMIRQQYCGQHFSESCQIVITEYLDRLGWDAATDFSFQARRILCQLDSFQGSRYLLLAGEYHDRHLPEALKLQSLNLIAIPDYATTIVHLLRNFELEPLMDSERDAIIARLRELSNTTLMALIPFAYNGQILLAEALNWHKAAPLINLIKRTALQTFSPESFLQTDIPNSPDPTSGVVNIAEVQAALDEAGEPLAREVIDVFRKSGEQVGNTLTLIEAVAGWNRARIEKGVKSQGQISIKAYGLLPLEQGSEEVLQRYLRLKQSAKDGKKFGQQRRASHAGAVQAAIANLVQRAGYADTGRFEWEMEAKLAAEVAPAGRIWQVGEYDLELTVDGVDVSLLIRRGSHVLKSAPKSVRDDDAYQEAKEAVQQLRSQVSRLKADLLEGLLVSGEMLTRDQLDQFLRLPLARGLFEPLVWRNDANEVGLLDVSSMCLRDLDGLSHSLTERVGLAHPYHLYQASVLAAWQRELVHQRIVQPLKQVFRELYLLTPAEQTTGRYSNRFAGHSIDGSVAARLFGARGWRTNQRGEGVTPYKVFGNMQAVFELADVLHYLGEGIPVTTDRIYFQSYPVSFAEWNGQDRQQMWLPLDQVPALVFSEAMRDADLVVSVAQREGEALLSNEVFEQRGSVIRALLDDLELPGVTIEGHFAYITGKLAHYRVHLGSATIHIDPGNYLCIVPDRWGQKHEKLFLPFADENDSKISEVISKILLLLADDKIKDESILRQIRNRTLS
ncbi:MAG: DUF4132 domain-containing protein [Chloroflexota bacterium]